MGEFLLLYVKEFLTKGSVDPYNILDVRKNSVEFHMGLIPSFSERKDAPSAGICEGERPGRPYQIYSDGSP